MRRLAPGSGYDAAPVRPGHLRINFINKSGRRVRLYQSNADGYEIFYRFTLRPNEPRTVAYPADGTYWIAYDFLTDALHLVNGRRRLETSYIRSGRVFDARIQSAGLQPESFVKKPKKPRFIETLVVLDDSMVEYHGEKKAVTYVTTIMNMVARVFTHRSLNVPIFVAVVGMVAMKQKPKYYRIETNRPDVSVESACRFARSIPNMNHDFALILTRRNIGPEGYASLFTMCTSRSCALVRENGPDSAFVIAHELGHALGMDHDENDDCYRDNVSGGNLMVKKLFATSANYQWSRCSQRMLKQNLGYFKCLDNKPKLNPRFEASINSLPGELIQHTEQCRYYQGPNATSCASNMLTACRYLWCKAKPDIACKPIWWHSPLEGTTCRKDNWCLRGRCVKQVKRVRVDGAWSQWTAFEPPCLKREGEQIKSWMIQRRNRTCNNPRPRGGGKRCLGTKDQNRIVQPDSENGCSPYSLKNFLLNGGVDRNSLYAVGCRSSTSRKMKWVRYTESEQEKQVNSLNLTCNFEEKGCGWKSSSLGVKNWNFGRGNTPSAKTGPSFDHTYRNTSGHFLYYEASWIQNTKVLLDGSRVVLESPRILASHICLRFAYHMYGKTIKGLEVHVRNGKHSRIMWSKKGEQGEKWHEAEVDLTINIEYKVTIEAVRGNSYHSDIAIDDISANTGPCKPKPPVTGGCTAVCRSVDKMYMHRTRLRDGTPCTLETASNGVCFKNVCQPVDCNGIIGSVAC